MPLVASQVEDYSEAGFDTQEVLKSHLKSARIKASELMASEKRFEKPPYSVTFDCSCESGKGHRIEVTVLSAGFIKQFGYSVSPK